MWGIDSSLLTGLTFFGDTSAAMASMREYLLPVIQGLSGLAGLVCVFFIVQAGYLYMSSTGNPEQIANAKEVLKKQCSASLSY